MFRLGSALSVGRKLYSDTIGRLIQKLSIRGTYSENLIDTRNIISDIDNASILDDATILLTPTAISDARVHSTKTYTGDEYITNGDFNGDASGWTLVNAAWQQGSGNGEVKLTKPSSGNSAVYQLGHTYTEGMTLRYKFKIIDYSGSASIRIDGYSGGNPLNTSTTFSASGGDVDITIKTDRAGVGVFLYITGGSTGDYIVLDDISVVDVSSDFDFDRASSATRINSDGLVQDMQSITDPELVLNSDFSEIDDNVLIGDNSTFDSGIGDWVSYGAGTPSHSTDKLEVSVTAAEGGARIPTNSLFTGGQSGKLLKVRAKLWLGTMTNTAFKAYIGGVQENVTLSSTPTYYDFYLKPTGSGNLIIYKTSIGGSAGTFFIDDVSVQQVDPNDRWDISSPINSSAIIENGVLKMNVVGGELIRAYQAYSFVNGNTYKVSFDLVGTDAKTMEIRDYISSGSVGNLSETISITSTNTTHTFIWTANANTNAIYFKRTTGTGDYNFSIDNVSLKDITFSTDVDLARINYDSNGENGHILLEPTSTNLIPYSEDFSQNSISGGTILSDNIISPDGALNGNVYEEDTYTSQHKIRKDVSVSAGTYTMSCFVKGTDRFVSFYPQGAGTAYAIFDIDNESITNTGGANYVNSIIEDYGNGWSRCSLTYNVSLGNSLLHIYLSNDSSTPAPSYLGNESEMSFYGLQLEESSFATSYIPTLTGSTVTRATETLTGSGNSTLINSTEGVLYAEIAALTDDLTNRSITISDGSTNNIVQILFSSVSNTIRCIIRVGGVGGDNLDKSTTSYTVTDFNKIALKWEQNNAQVWINGTQLGSPDTNSDVPIGLNDLSFEYLSIGNKFYGKCKALAVFDRALTDQELTDLTS